MHTKSNKSRTYCYMGIKNSLQCNRLKERKVNDFFFEDSGIDN